MLLLELLCRLGDRLLVGLIAFVLMMRNFTCRTAGLYASALDSRHRNFAIEDPDSSAENARGISRKAICSTRPILEGARKTQKVRREYHVI